MRERSPRVLHISSELGWRGGERQVKLLTDGLLARGFSCCVACPPSSALYRDRMSLGIAEPLSIRGELDMLAVLSLMRIAHKMTPDILHAHTSHAHAVGWLAASLLGLPLLVTRRVDFSISTNLFSRMKYLSSRVWYIAISEGVRQVLETGGIDPSRIDVVYSGVDITRYSYREGPRDEQLAKQLGIGEQEILILNVAALVDHKDHETLLRAAAILRTLTPRPWKLLIAGTGEEEPKLRRLVADLQIEPYVRFLGFVENLAPLFRAADFFVLSSHLEGLCTSILDAMVAGVPVVATAAGGVPEIVENEVTGLLVPTRSSEELARAMLHMMENPSLRRQLAENARRKVERRFTADAMVEGTLRVYEKVLSMKSEKS
jgi:glycosyltransferase involved in cell wall biosynthesis